MRSPFLETSTVKASIVVVVDSSSLAAEYISCVKIGERLPDWGLRINLAMPAGASWLNTMLSVVALDSASPVVVNVDIREPIRALSVVAPLKVCPEFLAPVLDCLRIDGHVVVIVIVVDMQSDTKDGQVKEDGEDLRSYGAHLAPDALLPVPFVLAFPD